MRWTKVPPASGYSPWRKWFAWIPVAIDMNQRAWLEIVERRRWRTEWETYSDWEYRTREKGREG